MNQDWALVCESCEKVYAQAPRWLCERCFGLLSARRPVAQGRIDPGELAGRKRNIWRYRELLPVDSPDGDETGWTPLVEAQRLAEELGLKQLLLKDEGSGFPSGSIMDRPAAVAARKARELGFEAVACATRGRLGPAVAAACARAAIPCYLFSTADGDHAGLSAAAALGARVTLLEGDEEQASLFCRDAAEEYGWAFTNLHLKPYWAEGMATFLYELAEQLEWHLPEQLVFHTATGLLAKKALDAARELERVGLLEAGSMRLFAVQEESCAPIAAALEAGAERVWPAAKSSSLAPSDPPWGNAALKAIKASGGSGATVSEDEAQQGRALLAESEGLLRGLASGAAVWAAKALASQGRLNPEATTVIALTDGPPEAQEESAASFRRIKLQLSAFDGLLRTGLRESRMNSVQRSTR